MGEHEHGRGVAQIGRAVVGQIGHVPVERRRVLLVQVVAWPAGPPAAWCFSRRDGGFLDGAGRLHLVDDFFVGLDDLQGGVLLVLVVQIGIAHGDVGRDRFRHLAAVVQSIA